MAKTYGKLFEEQIIEPHPDSSEDVLSARSILIRAGLDLNKLVNPRDMGMKQRPEVKTDIYYKAHGNEYKISVKYGNHVQLCSINRESAQKYFSVASQLAGLAEHNDIQDLINDFSTLPKKVDKSEWTQWSDGPAKRVINDKMNGILDKHPRLRYSLAEVALTGKELFSDLRGEADHVLTENKLVPIDKEYIQACSDNMRLQFRCKSRKGNSEACLRIDLDMRKV